MGGGEGRRGGTNCAGWGAGHCGCGCCFVVWGLLLVDAMRRDAPGDPMGGAVDGCDALGGDAGGIV